MKYIHHITLNTGHDRRSYRDEVDDAIMPVMHELLAHMLAGERVSVPAVEETVYLTGSAEGRCLVATVSEASPIVTIAVAGRSLCGAGLWRMLHETSPRQLATADQRPPPSPWCAARLEIGSLTHQSVMEWVGDFERCLAWAWLERQ